MDAPIRTLDQRYELRSRIGGGANGEVFVGWDRQNEMEVAIKVLRRHEEIDESSVSSASSAARETDPLEEARRLAMVQHPHVLRVFDARESVQGERFIVTELLMVPGTDGVNQRAAPSLRTWIAELGTGTGLSQRDVAVFMVRLCKGVQAVHERGMYHGDLKPDNILVAPGGSDDGAPQPVVADFGLSRSLGGMGTPEWMSPAHAGQVLEEARGSALSASAKDGLTQGIQADYYALGAIMFYLLTGFPPYPSDGNVLTRLERVASDGDGTTRRKLDKKKLRLSPALAAICESAMSENGFGSVLSMIRSLEGWLATTSPSDVWSVARWYRRVLRGFVLQFTPFLGGCFLGPLMPDVQTSSVDQGVFLFVALLVFVPALCGAAILYVGTLVLYRRTGVGPGPLLLIAVFMFPGFGLVSWVFAIVARGRARKLLLEAGVPVGSFGPSDMQVAWAGYPR